MGEPSLKAPDTISGGIGITTASDATHASGLSSPFFSSQATTPMSSKARPLAQ